MSRLIRQVALKNYKSIAQCRVDLQDIALLVGPNGAGKSNFVDALRLIAEALSTTLDHAIRQRGGINEVRRRSGGHPTHFAISLRLALGEGHNAHYAIRIGAKPEGAFSVQREQVSISTPGVTEASFLVVEGEVVRAGEELGVALPKISADRLFLTALSGIAPYRALYDALSGMRFYSINPDPIKELQSHDSGDRLDRSGWNLAAVIRRLSDERPASLARIQEYLQRIVPGVDAVEYKAYGARETLVFRQAVSGQLHPWRFDAAAMSDGTLRSLGILAALFHSPIDAQGPAPFVAIEEPEITIHPAAASIVMDAMLEASKGRQIVATTHSSDLLEHPEISSESIFAVRNENGETRISNVDDAAVSAIKDDLYSPGELLRAGQLSPKIDRRAKVTEADLFGDAA